MRVVFFRRDENGRILRNIMEYYVTRVERTLI